MEKLLYKFLRKNLSLEQFDLERVTKGHRTAYVIKESGKPYGVVKLFRGLDTWKRYYNAHEFFKEENLSVPKLLISNKNLSTRLFCGGFLLVEEWVSGGDLENNIENMEVLKASGKALAMIHNIQSPNFGPVLSSTNNRFNENSMRNSVKHQLDNIGSLLSNKEKSKVNELLNEGFSKYPWERDYSLCHRDACPDNILVREEDNSVVFIDLASVSFHLFFFDLVKLLFCIEEINTESAKHFLDSYLESSQHLYNGEWEENENLYRIAFHLKSCAQYFRRYNKRKDKKHLDLAKKHSKNLIKYIEF